MGRIKKFLKILGPGFITGASDDDPSGIATYSQTGAQFGYSQLWMALFSTPFMTVIQEMCGRIGLVTGRGIAYVIRENYSKKILYAAVLLLLIANTVNIGADLGAMASSAELVTGIPFVVLLLVMTFITLVLEIFVSYRVYSKYLKYLALALLSYIVTAFVVQQDWSLILRSTLIPSFSWDKAYILNTVAILGTTISPYLFFWQADEEVEEEIAQRKLGKIGSGLPRITSGDVKKMRADTLSGMLFSNVIMFFIIVTVASTLGFQGYQNIETASQAAEALRPVAGDFTFLLFAIGIIGTGLLAVPILAGSASYAISEAFGWKTGLYRKLKKAHGFYGIITLATLIGLLINFTAIQPFRMLYYTAVLNGIIAPPLMVLIILISSNKMIMGNYTNSRISNIVGWFITIVMAVSALLLFIL
jgi:NRAMP (natural resistance-associated macrophage protein)-like metal ion transporter